MTINFFTVINISIQKTSSRFIRFAKRKVIFLIYLFFQMYLFSLQAAVDSTDSGLYFYSYETPKDNRTSLFVPLSKIYGLKKNFSLKFDLRLRSEKEYFGFIFRMLNDKYENLDLILSDYYMNEQISLNVSDRVILQFNKSEIPEFKPDNKWNTIELKFKDDSVRLTINAISKVAVSPFKKMEDFNIWFGTNNDNMYFTYDIPAMVLKNLYILNDKGGKIRHWSLDKHNNNIVYDEYKGEEAQTINPKWEIDDHCQWTKRVSFLFEKFPQIAFDDVNEKIYFVSQNSMKIYDTKIGKVDSLQNITGEPFIVSPNHLIYDTNNQKLVSYDFSNDGLRNFNFESKSWNNSDAVILKPDYWHHARTFLADDSLLVAFGGYGHHVYKSKLMKYSFNDKKWRIIDFSESIFPRYLGCMGYLGEGKLLYFGGYGNKSGNQNIHTHNFYDLYLIDTRNDSVKQLWDIGLIKERENYTCSNSMVIDKKNNKFYTLVYDNRLYNTKIYLKQFDIKTAENKSVGDSIPYFFADNRSFCDLYLCSTTNQLIAVTAHTKDPEGVSLIEIFSINYRPMSVTDVTQHPESINIRFVIYVLSGVFLCFMIWLIFKKRKNKKLEETITEGTDNFERNTINWDELNDVQVDIKPSSIYLLGGFQVINKNGKDVTKSFSPLVKSLFLIILLYTIKTKKGISSLALKDMLWFDKDDNSARNNRNVNLSKLRSLLVTVGKIEINDVNNYWCMVIDKSVFCDYQSIMTLFAKLKSEHNVNRIYVNELLRLLSKGVLLPNVHTEWVDQFKANFTSVLIDVLLEVSHKTEMEKDYELLYKIGDVILLHDDIDEEGISLKCYGLYNLHKKGKALQSYNKFCIDYKTLLGEEYKVPFNDLISRSF